MSSAAKLLETLQYDAAIGKGWLMGAIFRIFIIVICIAAIAAGLGLVLQTYFAFAFREAIIVAVMGFCVLMVLQSNYVLQRHLRHIQGHFRDVSRLEREFSNRLRQLESQAKQHDVATSGGNATPVTPESTTNTEAGNFTKTGGENGLPNGGILNELSSIRREKRKLVPDERHNDSRGARASDNIVELNSRKEMRAKMASSAKSTASNYKIKPSQLTKALKKGCTELYLQPVMELPDRNIRYFEAFIRLRMGDNMLSARQFLPVAKNSGQVAQIDFRSLELTIKVVRGLQRQEIEYPVFWNIAPQTLGNAKLFNEILELLKANQPLNHQLICEIAHDSFRKLNNVQRDNLAQIRDLGFKLSLDGISSDGYENHDIGSVIESEQFSYLKVPAIELMRIGEGDISNFAAHIVPLTMKHHITLIASDLDNEAQSVSMIDADIYLAQGDALMPAKALKKEFGKKEFG